MVHAHDIKLTKWEDTDNMIIFCNQFNEFGWPMDVKISLLASEFGHMLLKTIKAFKRTICFNKLTFAIDHQFGSKGWLLYSSALQSFQGVTEIVRRKLLMMFSVT
jgi:hypothetical protein